MYTIEKIVFPSENDIVRKKYYLNAQANGNFHCASLLRSLFSPFVYTNHFRWIP